MMVSLRIAFTGTPRKFLKYCLEELFRNEPLLLKKNSTADLISGIIHDFKNTKGGKLQFANILKGNSITELFQGILQNFQNTLRKFDWEIVFSSIATCRLQVCNQGWKENLGISRWATTFRNMQMYVIEFLAELQNAEFV